MQNEAEAATAANYIKARAERERARYTEDAPHCRAARAAYDKVILWCDEIIAQANAGWY